MNNKASNNYLHNEPATTPWLILPLILTMTIIPLILGIHSFFPNYGSQYWATNNSTNDIFLYYKAFCLAVMGGIMILILLIYRFLSQKKFAYGANIIPIYVYIISIIISTVFSISIYHSLHGIQHHFESAFALLAYCVLVLYGAYFIDNDRCLKWFIYGFLIGVAILALFGSMQYASGVIKGLYDNGTLSADSGFYFFMNKLFGCNDPDWLGYRVNPSAYPTSEYQKMVEIMQKDTIRFIYQNSAWYDKSWYTKLDMFNTRLLADLIYLPTGRTGGHLTLNFQLGQTYMTVYNPNYIAFFTTLTAPFFAALAFFQKHLWQKIIFALVCVLSIICLLGSRSVAGFFSLGISFLVLIVAFRRKIFKRWLYWGIGIGVLAVGLLVLQLITGVVSERWNYMMGKLSSSTVAGYHNENTYHLTNLTSTKDGIVIDYDNTKLSFSMDYDEQKGISCQFKDETGKELKTKTTTDADGNKIVSVTEKRYTIKNDKNEDVYSIKAVLDEDLYLPSCTLQIDSSGWVVTNQLKSAFYAYTSNPNTPLTVMQKKTDQKLGTFYERSMLPQTSAVQLLQSIANDTGSLTSCMNQLAQVNSEYADIRDSILNSSNPNQMAMNYFSKLLGNTDSLTTFFYYLTISGERDTNYYYQNQYLHWTAIGSQPDTAIFTNYPKLASNRGFIWARTLPLLVESPRSFLIGSGPDTFIYRFPHYDYVSLSRTGYSGQIITKPHSLYLQIASNTGVPSAIALIAFYIIYLITCIRLYWKSPLTSLASRVSVAILASVTGYMVSGITNDSTVTYAFVFWGLMGVGIAANHMEKKRLAAEEEEKQRAANLEQKRLEREERKKNKADKTSSVQNA